MGLNFFKWFGGKFYLANWVIENLPPHDIYVEPFCGAANVLLNKPPSLIEVINDINNDIVNLFRAMQDEKRYIKLRRRLRNTPYARSEFYRAIEILHDRTSDDDDRAWAFYVVCTQGFGGG